MKKASRHAQRFTKMFFYLLVVAPFTYIFSLSIVTHIFKPESITEEGTVAALKILEAQADTTSSSSSGGSSSGGSSSGGGADDSSGGKGDYGDHGDGGYGDGNGGDCCS